MNLGPAFRLSPGDLVAFTGGGGKTTAMFRLAQEWAAGGRPVITTTTTRIFAAQTSLAPAHFAWGEAPLGAIATVLLERRHVLVTGPVDRDIGKALGVPFEALAALSRLPGPPLILVEADGSRMRPFKAPATHEPVVPPQATHVVPVVGADVFGAPLDGERVHRPERVVALSGASLGAPIRPATVAAVLAHPAGGLKGAPAAAQVIPLINKVESARTLELGRATARRLLAEPRIAAVVLGAARPEAGAREVWGRVAAVVLAAGQSKRMGRPKLLLPWRGGLNLLASVVAQLQQTAVTEVVVVTGAEARAVEAALAALPKTPVPVRTVHNPDYATSEMARSLQCGLGSLPGNVSAALVALADQPDLDPAVAGQVIDRWRATLAAVVAPAFAGQRGHPLLFDRSAWQAVAALPAQANPRQVLAGLMVELVPVDSKGVLRDIDTPDDYARALNESPEE